MSISRNGIPVLIALVCAVLIALPASAAPPLHRVAGGGWGVTRDDTGTNTDVAGDTVHFTCAAIQGADGAWSGEGTFSGHLDGAPIRAHYVVDRGTTYTGPMFRDANLWGEAEVSYRGVTSTQPFFMLVLQDATGKPNNNLVTAIFLGEEGTDFFHWWPIFNGGMRGGAINID
ncbi:MAG: hypothetical protein ABFC89_12055 [Methanospirillum sp.]